MTSRFPASRVLTAPDDPLTGLTLAVVEDDGDLFPNPPFRAISFITQQVPDIGTDACYINVTAIDDDLFTFTREDPTAPIHVGNIIAVVSTIPIYDNGATVRITGLFPGDGTMDVGTLTITDPQGVVTTHNAAPPIVVVGGGDYYYNLVANQGGIWTADWVGPNGETVPLRKFFVRF